MKGLALYRAFDSEEVVRISGEVVEYGQGCKDGFVVAGFEGERWFIRNEGLCDDRVFINRNDASAVCLYREAFGKFSKVLREGRFEKLVLSRREFLNIKVNPEQAFMNACSIYPDQTVILFSTPQTGTWLVVTPELLVEMKGTEGRTMALAGTKKGERAWTEKERREQAVVAEYIEEKLKGVAERVIRYETEDAQAGELTHLRTRFEFQSNVGWSEVAHSLHPTPAVCGLPAEEAKEFILRYEGYDRRFYSGYCGVVRDAGCRLMVTLRCAEICEEGCWLYAGGGLLAESDEESEFVETENKMQTIIKCIAVNHR